MIVSRPTVHPVEAPPLIDGGLHNGPRTRMKDVQGMPGTRGGLTLRLIQCAFGVTFEPSRRFAILLLLRAYKFYGACRWHLLMFLPFW
ncbi:hypothetical protein K2173_024732 [Erythroxylum novogranatense]|uniref:Uncharacterized protein n=1 Tax=Erythroxylum novogranatense TaxID=1862640 RepID=A0AAV8SVZ1_9ROSI|nr:hypothetical protein K2173_024732 [Erythroxylum novogranatense]